MHANHVHARVNSRVAAIPYLWRSCRTLETLQEACDLITIILVLVKPYIAHIFTYIVYLGEVKWLRLRLTV
ncbi:hypothetical protein HRbin01_00281 [archaeon HR01]|nr:hypothetical protein HRbin01_00281 [archaeon HR01]